MCLKKYAAHAMCKHPDKVLPPGENWTQYVEIDRCHPCELAARHARRNVEETECADAAWVPDIDWNLNPFCFECDSGSHGNTITSATFMYTDFETKKDQWESEGGLSKEETQAIQKNIDDLRGQFDSESLRGPYNNSYWVLQGNLDGFTAYWEKFLNDKKEAREEEARQRLEYNMYTEARQDSRIADVAETSIYDAGLLPQLEASRADLAA